MCIFIEWLEGRRYTLFRSMFAIDLCDDLNETITKSTVIQ